ncbi:MAG TPA: ABC transporter permease [Dongiaceae bacterium]|jgi:microcin C transport system permease protein|nr:ABC transporter permease [Dongiaceae bacterium]
MTATPPAALEHRFLGFRISQLTARRIENFRNNRRGYYSLLVFLVLLVISLFAEVIANDKPIVVSYHGSLYFPILKAYPETTFGGTFVTEANYRSAYVRKKIEAGGWMVWPPIPFSYNTTITDLPSPAPSPPDGVNWLGTDDQARDVMARAIYGFRISVLFGIALTICTTIIGVLAGAVQGYFGGWLDLLFQRFLEVFGSLPTLYILLILSAIFPPSIISLFIILLIFGWTWPVGVVRAEFLRVRNLEYVRAAKALGMSDWRVMGKHILPNAMVTTLTFLPFQLGASVTILTSLDFLGLGLPPGSPSLGEMLNQGKNNLQAPWLGITGFVVTGTMLILLIFIGEAIRDAFNPRKIAK